MFRILVKYSSGSSNVYVDIDIKSLADMANKPYQKLRNIKVSMQISEGSKFLGCLNIIDNRL